MRLVYYGFSPTAAADIYTLSLHDALPILLRSDADIVIELIGGLNPAEQIVRGALQAGKSVVTAKDRKSTRLNSSHRCTSYAVFCLKKTTASAMSRGGWSYQGYPRHTSGRS